MAFLNNLHEYEVINKKFIESNLFFMFSAAQKTSWVFLLSYLSSRLVFDVHGIKLFVTTFLPTILGKSTRANFSFRFFSVACLVLISLLRNLHS